jgi:hypothetical protein
MVGWVLGFALGIWVGALSLAWKLRKEDEKRAKKNGLILDTP